MNERNRQRESLPPADVALATLKAVAAEIALDIPENVIERLYVLQKRHQFDSDRSASIQEMKRILEAHVERPGNEETE